MHINNTLYLSSYNINRSTIDYYFAQITTFRPQAIEGYPSSLYSLALFLKESNLQVCIPITFTSSESLLSYQRELIEKQLQTEIFDRYGMTERTICLIESNNHNGYYEAPGYSINEYLVDGEICTSLINYSFPMIRYRSNDVVELMEATEENPQMIVKRIEGRKDDYVICKDGSMVSRIDFIESGKHFKACQWVQIEKGKVQILVVPDKGFTEQDALFIKDATLERVGHDNLDIELKFVCAEDLIYTKRGKFRLIVNRINKTNY